MVCIVVSEWYRVVSLGLMYVLSSTARCRNGADLGFGFESCAARSVHIAVMMVLQYAHLMSCHVTS